MKEKFYIFIPLAILFIILILNLPHNKVGKELTENKNLTVEEVLRSFTADKLQKIKFQVDESSIVFDPWLNGFPYRKPITIDNTQNSNTLTDYQVLVTVDTASLISAGKMRNDCGDIRFTDSDGTTQLNYWLESDCNSANTKIWVKVPSIPASSTKTIYIYYGNPSATSASNVSNTFIQNQIYAMSGQCPDVTYCGYMDNHTEADYIRVNFPSNICTKYVDSIDWRSVCDNSGPACPFVMQNVRDYFYQRFRFLFVAPVSGTWTFSISSDEASELVIQYSDAYNNNYNHTFVNHTVITSWYGGHGASCNVPTAYNGSIILSAGQGVWLEYIGEDWTLWETVRVMVIDLRDNTWKILSASNFNGYIFSRKYTSPEPTTSVGSEDVLVTQAGSPTNWSWKIPSVGEKIRSGYATNWNWVTFQNDGTGITVPRGSATSWQWGP